MDALKKELLNYQSLVVKALLLLLVSGSILLLVESLGAFKSLKFIGAGVEFRNTITVSGKGEVQVTPDIAELSFAVIEEAKSVAVAQEAVTKKMNTILLALDDIGVAEKDIKTTSYNIVPRYEYGEIRPEIYYPEGNRVLVGYEVSHWVSIKIRSLDKAGEILANIGNMGVSNLSGLNFIVEDEEKAMRDARRLAVKDAKEKARALADDFGVDIVKVLSFNESGGPVYFKDYATLELARGEAVSSSPEIPAGENTITSNVTITYAIK